MMDNKIQYIHKNVRYKILHMNGEYYILDMDSSYWLFILPFLNWLFAHKAYKIDGIMLKQIQSYESERTNVGILAMALSGLGLFLTVIFRSLINGFTLLTSFGFNLVLLITAILMLALIRVLLHHKLKRKMNQHISLEDTPFITLKVRDIKTTFYSTYLFQYVIIWGMTIVFSLTFINLGGVILLVAALLILYLGVIMNFQSIRVGKVKVVILDDKASSPLS